MDGPRKSDADVVVKATITPTFKLLVAVSMAIGTALVGIGNKIWNVATSVNDQKWHQTQMTDKIASHDDTLKSINEKAEGVRGDVRDVKLKLDLLYRLCLKRDMHTDAGANGGPATQPANFSTKPLILGFDPQ